MAPPPLELSLELSARERFEMVELRSRFSSEHDESLASYPRCLYWSAHTTAGFLDRSLIRDLGSDHISTYLETLRQIFPEGAGYAHDRLERRRISTPPSARSSRATATRTWPSSPAGSSRA
jgi:thiamine phosphate synthase YjbQ (UPF0047 family)